METTIAGLAAGDSSWGEEDFSADCHAAPSPVQLKTMRDLISTMNDAKWRRLLQAMAPRS